ncbi:hypothetical protein [Hyphomonas sp.]|jgi:hypothetical protein|uniref:hypothetical protein n=1 Tax=Hyphomonas sp. TaxID=87 RepID=UPI0025C31492|nr:hypothetical protein [Hyphomonas sp.]MBI1398952.1 hypothetical protein [Hyphomonas sp.]
MHFGEIIALIALGFGAALGMGGLFAPDWAARIVRLKADPERPGGYSEFRATYGGLFLMLHLTALLMVLQAPPAMALAAVLPVSAGWFGAAIGRVFAMSLDRGKGGEAKILPVWMAIEIALGLAIAAPFLQFTA